MADFCCQRNADQLVLETRDQAIAVSVGERECCVVDGGWRIGDDGVQGQGSGERMKMRARKSNRNRAKAVCL
jgi:hypothetical protein